MPSPAVARLGPAPSSMPKLKGIGFAFGARLVAYRANPGQTGPVPQAHADATRPAAHHAPRFRAGDGGRLRAAWRRPYGSPATGAHRAVPAAPARGPRHRRAVQIAVQHGDAATRRRGAGPVLAPAALGQRPAAVPRLAGRAQPACRAEALVPTPPAAHRRHPAAPERRRPGGHAGHRRTPRPGQPSRILPSHQPALRARPCLLGGGSRIALREVALPVAAPPHDATYPLLVPGPVRFEETRAGFSFDTHYLRTTCNCRCAWTSARCAPCFSMRCR